jgi:hypothetical protein
MNWWVTFSAYLMKNRLLLFTTHCETQRSRGSTKFTQTTITNGIVMAAEDSLVIGAELDERLLSSIKEYRYVGISTDLLKDHFGLKKEYEPYTTLEEFKRSLQHLQDSDNIIQIGTRWLLHPDLFRVTKGHAIAPEFQWFDVLILYIICHSRTAPATLEAIAINVEFIERAPLTLDDMHGALNRLFAAHLIKKRKQKYSPSDKAIEMLKKAKADSGSDLRDQAKSLQLIINCPCCGVKLKRVTWRINVTEVEMKAAYQFQDNL